MYEFSFLPVLRHVTAVAIAFGFLSVSAASAADAPAAGRSAGEMTVDEIVRRVAVNQSKSIEDRDRWLFRQRVLVRLFRTNGKLAREELRHYDVQPKSDSITRDMISLEGKVEIGGKLYPYADPGYRTGNIDLDGEIAGAFCDVMFHDKGRDGEDDDLFPLVPGTAARHVFRLHGKQEYRGREVYRLTFKPGRDDKGERGNWKGEVLVDAATLQPVLVITEMARGIPFAVRALLGINIKQFGFKLEYAEMEDGVWFPSKYSGEFSLRVLFGYTRRIALSLQNFDFQRASADTVIHYGAEATGGEEPDSVTAPQ